MNKKSHIPYFDTIGDFFQLLSVPSPKNRDLAIIKVDELKGFKHLDLPLFRCNFYSLILFSNAESQLRGLSHKTHLSTHSIYFSSPQNLENWGKIRKEWGYCLFFTDECVHLENLPNPGMILLSTVEADQSRIANERILLEVKGDHEDKLKMIPLLLHQYLIQLRRIQQEQTHNRPRSEINATKTFNRFKLELDKYFEELAEGKLDYQASVSSLAERMHLNPSYLNTLIKNLTGKTASSYIKDKIILEAQSYLRNTDYQVLEISFRLGFSNVTYFNRFFKKWTQTTPMEYRKVAQK